MALYTIGGSVSPGYEAVYEAFESNFVKSREANSQLCVYVSGVKVVDLWGSVKDSKYNGDSLQNVFSSTKNLTAIAIAWCVDQGLLCYDDPLVKHWPELKYKNDIKVCDVLRHESGLQKFSKGFTYDDMQRSNIKNNNSIGKVIEMELQEFPEASKRCYHTLTRGWILNELFRRVHPQKLTIGEFLRREFATGPLEAAVYIGFESESDPALDKVIDLETMGIGSLVLQSCLPSFSKYKKVDLSLVQLASNVKNMQKRMRSSVNLEKPSEIVMENVSKFSTERCLYFNKKEMRTSEIPSANGTCSARGLAKLASIMSMKGSLNGNKFISENTWSKMHSEPTRELDPLIGVHTKFALGGVCQFTEEKGKNSSFEIASKNRDGYYGWMGFGGSVFQWYPEKEIGFAYVPTYLEWYDLLNVKGSILQKAVVECVDKLKTTAN